MLSPPRAVVAMMLFALKRGVLPRGLMAHPERFELPTNWLEAMLCIEFEKRQVFEF
jgi:hypothetical protein